MHFVREKIAARGGRLLAHRAVLAADHQRAGRRHAQGLRFRQRARRSPISPSARRRRSATPTSRSTTSSATPARRMRSRRCCAALEFKCDVLWAMLDALLPCLCRARARPARRLRAEGASVAMSVEREHSRAAESPPIAATPRACRAACGSTHNEAQGGWVLLAPERVFKADAIAVEILKRCTGEATLRRDRRRPGARPSTRRASASMPT